MCTGFSEKKVEVLNSWRPIDQQYGVWSNFVVGLQLLLEVTLDTFRR